MTCAQRLPQTPVAIVVDEWAVFKFCMAEALEEAGFSVVSFERASDAAAFLETAGAVDVLVAEVAWPGLEGLRLAEETARRRPDTGLFLTTVSRRAAALPLPAGCSLFQKGGREFEVANAAKVFLDRRDAVGPDAPPFPAL